MRAERMHCSGTPHKFGDILDIHLVVTYTLKAFSWCGFIHAHEGPLLIPKTYTGIGIM